MYMMRYESRSSTYAESDYNYEIAVSVWEFDEDDDEVEVARFEFYYFDAHRMLNDQIWDTYYHLGVHADTEDYIGLFYSEKPGYQSNVERFLGERSSHLDTLYLNRAEIVAEHRSAGNIVIMLNEILKRLCVSVGLVAMEPYALQCFSENDDDTQSAPNSWMERLKLSDFTSDKANSYKKVSKAFMKAGFVKFDTKVLILNPSNIYHNVPIDRIRAYEFVDYDVNETQTYTSNSPTWFDVKRGGKYHRLVSASNIFTTGCGLIVSRNEWIRQSDLGSFTISEDDLNDDADMLCSKCKIAYKEELSELSNTMNKVLSNLDESMKKRLKSILIEEP